MPPIQIAAPLAAAFNNQSPNLKTALRLTEAFFSYTPESLRATFDKDVADDFTWIPLPQSLKALGWNPLSKEESIKAIPFFFERIKDLEVHNSADRASDKRSLIAIDSCVDHYHRSGRERKYSGFLFQRRGASLDCFCCALTMLKRVSCSLLKVWSSSASTPMGKWWRKKTSSTPNGRMKLGRPPRKLQQPNSLEETVSKIVPNKLYNTMLCLTDPTALTCFDGVVISGLSCSSFESTCYCNVNVLDCCRASSWTVENVNEQSSSSANHKRKRGRGKAKMTERGGVGNSKVPDVAPSTSDLKEEALFLFVQ
ncbi:uncharacterized protein EI90DRAFT_348457 [Cantharellus anzutake]|uniref:uncharacterized protein n=1 Tax=Cantharellus anzutake TaxID=1750568 RepID=UPI001907A6AB|nr:uncharacterized protein EI90DRAFT_348457 [Cantharellus anzutake]KAF8315497.1 hypothetical protein EI90DRAFT_348457 [Cantharellus anzutake]